jgi:TPR repeat protein
LDPKIGCVQLGNDYLNGAGVAKDEARAAEFFRKACDGGLGWGCSRIGWMYQTGHGLAKDEALAAKFLRQACDMGHAASCENLQRLARGP